MVLMSPLAVALISACSIHFVTATRFIAFGSAPCSYEWTFSPFWFLLNTENKKFLMKIIESALVVVNILRSRTKDFTVESTKSNNRIVFA